MIEGGLYRVTAPHFVAGLIVAANGTILRAPPLMGWARDRPLAEVLAYCRNKKFEVMKVTEVAEKNAG
jgi:hypothetical protein